MTDYFVKVTEGFDPADPQGALVVCPDLLAGIYFTEKAWDAGEIEGTRIIRVRPCPRRPAGHDALLGVLADLGIDLESGAPEDVLPGLVCLREDVRSALEARGFDSVDIPAGIVISNWETGAKLLWRPDTFEIVPEPKGVPALAVDRPEGCLRFSFATSEGATAVLRALDAAGDNGWGSLYGFVHEALAGTGLAFDTTDEGRVLTIASANGAESWSLIRNDFWTPGNAILSEEGFEFAPDIPLPVPPFGR